jgi:hypothetical protein
LKKISLEKAAVRLQLLHYLAYGYFGLAHAKKTFFVTFPCRSYFGTQALVCGRAPASQLNLLLEIKSIFTVK